MSARRRTLAVVVVVLGLMVAVASAQAADPDAPAGAPATWLPAVPWVMDHYIPYDETKLFSALGMSRGQVLQWLTAHDDKAPLSQLARRRGFTVAGLAARLVGPRVAGQSAALHAQLVQRAQLTLTQPHLAHHLFGHLYHEWALLRALPRLMRYPSLHAIMLQRWTGMTYAQIAAWRGVSARALRSELAGVLTAAEREGVRSGQETSTQGQFWLAEQLGKLPRFLALPGVIRRPGQALSAANAVTLLCHPL